MNTAMLRCTELSDHSILNKYLIRHKVGFAVKKKIKYENHTLKYGSVRLVYKPFWIFFLTLV